jgi:hypothetical protein
MASLDQLRDPSEREVAQFLWGCNDCGYIVEQNRSDVCPACGSIAGDFEMFAPFFSATGERIARRQPGDIIAMLRGDSARYADSLDALRDETLRRKAAPGEWCIAEVAGHMIDIAELFCRRLRSLTEPDIRQPAERTPLPWKLLDGQGYESMSVNALNERFAAANAEALALVESLDAEGWRARAEFVAGKVSVIDLGSWLVNHNRAHIEQVRGLRERFM